MTAYRSQASRPVYDVETAADPFPEISCFDCGEPTTSMNGEDLCAACDLKWLRRGIDWARFDHDARRWGGPGHHYKAVRCGSCEHMVGWPYGFPSHIYAECHKCARERIRLEERKTIAIIIARVGQIAADIVAASRGL